MQCSERWCNGNTRWSNAPAAGNTRNARGCIAPSGEAPETPLAPLACRPNEWGSSQREVVEEVLHLIAQNFQDLGDDLQLSLVRAGEDDRLGVGVDGL